MGVILAIAFDAASSLDGGWASSIESSASLFLATLTSLGLWLVGRRQARFAAAAAGGRRTPGLVEGVAHRLAWHLRRLPVELSPSPVTVLLPQSSARPLAPDRRRFPGRTPDPAALSSPLRAPPGPDPDSARPPRGPAARP
jgi:hypothetical protein